MLGYLQTAPRRKTSAARYLVDLELISININSKRGKKFDLMAFLEVHQPHVVAIQGTKIDSSVATSELFPETCQYNIFRKDRNLHHWGVMLLIHKGIPHMPLSELENDSKSVWAKYLQIKLPIM